MLYERKNIVLHKGFGGIIFGWLRKTLDIWVPLAARPWPIRFQIQTLEGKGEKQLSLSLAYMHMFNANVLSVFKDFSLEGLLYVS